MWGGELSRRDTPAYERLWAAPKGRAFLPLPLQPRHAASTDIPDKVSSNKGPFHALQAGPLSALKKAIETGSHENHLSGAPGFAPTNRARMQTTPALLVGVGMPGDLLISSTVKWLRRPEGSC